VSCTARGRRRSPPLPRSAVAPTSSILIASLVAAALGAALLVATGRGRDSGPAEAGPELDSIVA